VKVLYDVSTFLIGSVWALCAAALMVLGFFRSISLEGGEGSRQLHIVGGLVPLHLDGTGGGREAEIVAAAFEAADMDLELVFHTVPFGRHWAQFERDSRFGAVLMVPGDLDLGGYRSPEYTLYQNGIIFRSDSFPDGLGADPLSGLTDKRVVSFPGARDIIPGLDKDHSRFGLYAERPYQFSHAAMLESGFVDAVIADELVTAHYLKRVAGHGALSDASDYVFAPAFCPTAYRIVFRDEALRRAFARGLATIRANGEHKRITGRYQENGVRRDSASGTMQEECQTWDD